MGAAEETPASTNPLQSSSSRCKHPAKRAVRHEGFHEPTCELDAQNTAPSAIFESIGALQNLKIDQATDQIRAQLKAVLLFDLMERIPHRAAVEERQDVEQFER